MPLLHRKDFIPIKPPSDLEPDDEVFHCPLTNEIFRDYEEFYERTILCNSLVWSCSITDRPNLTFQEALDCEKTAKKKLSRVSPTILKPFLFLVGFSKRSRVDELNEDLYSFVKERFFVGEMVEVTENKIRQPCTILKVLPLNELQVNGHVNGGSPVETGSSSEDEDDMPLSKYRQSKPLGADEVKYVVKCANGSEKTVANSCIRRKPGVYTRQTSKLFLKGNCIKSHGQATDNYVVKNKIKIKLELDKVKWENIFTGPVPSFFSSPKPQRTKKVTDGGSSKAKSEMIKEKERREKEELKQAREAEKEERKREKEELRKKKTEELEKIKEAARANKEKKRKEREEELLKTRLHKLEEKRRLAEYLKEWSRPRDDLECDDLKELPSPHEVKSLVPPALFGDALSLLEFFNTFGGLFDVADEFPNGVNFALISKALMEHNHHGPLCNFLFFFLSNLFRTNAEEEDGFEQIHTDSTDMELYQRLPDQVNEDTLQSFATIASTWPTTYQGYALSKLELDSYTVTEILRLYLLTSAARPRSGDRLWRFQHRGGYGIMDDTPLSLCIQQPELIEKLSSSSVFDLTPEEKVSILLCLSNHLMSFVAPRDYLDETLDKLLQAQQAYRDDKTMERRREKELATEKYKFKCEQMNLEKQARLKEAEEKLRRAELGLPEDEEAGRSLRKRKQEVEDDEPRLLDPVERVERLRAFEEEELQAREAWGFRLQKHQQAIDKHKSAFRVNCLGQDRYFRRYFSISSVPGVFVEEFIDDDLTEDLLKVKVTQKGSIFKTSTHSGGSTPGLSENNSAAGTPGGNTSGLTNQFSGTTSLNTTQGSLNFSHIAPSSNNTTSQPSTPGSKLPTPFRKLGLNDNHGSPILKQAICNNASSVNDHPADVSMTDETQSCDALKFTQGKEHRWLVYSTPEEIDSLLESLNSRGYRESNLRKNLSTVKDLVSSRLKMKQQQLDQFLTLDERRGTSVKDEKCEKKMESLLRDQILDLEARLWAGTLGTARVGNRVVWRECMQNGTKYEGIIPEDTSMPIIKGEQNEGNDEPKPFICEPVISFPSRGFEKKESSIEIDDEASNKIKELSVALLLVERGVDRKYLKHPLGYAIDNRRLTRSRSQENEETQKRQSEILLKRWESSLLSCSSLPQIFLHLSTLERSIMWSRSILNAKCRICHRKGDAEKMLLCDACDRGHHMYCLKPALKNIPAGDWFCPDCKPKSAKLSPRKVVRTKSFSQADSSDEDEESEEEESEEEVEVSEDNTSSEEELPEPPKKKLTYKIGPKARKSTPVSKNPREKKEKSKRNSGKLNIGVSKRRSDAVWTALSACEEILSVVIKHKDSWPFLDPVSKRLVPDYYTIITKPMDLGTVLRKLKNVEYQSPSDFIEDVDQIFLNCHEYNDSRSTIAKTATHLQTFFDSKLNEAGLSNYRTPYVPAKKRRTN